MRTRPDKSANMKDVLSHRPTIQSTPNSNHNNRQQYAQNGYSFSSDTAIISKQHGRKLKPYASNVNPYHSYTKFPTKEPPKNYMAQKSKSPSEKKLHDNTKEKRHSSLKSLNTYRLRPVRIRKDDIVVSFVLRYLSV